MKYKEKAEKLEAQLRFEQRENFIEKYRDFNKWLSSLWFEPDFKIHWEYAFSYWTDEDYWFERMSKPEVWVNKIFNYATIFVLDNNNHWGLFTYSYMRSEYMTLDEMKESILNDLKKIKNLINSIQL